MAKPTKLVVDCSTGVSTEVPLTEEEITQQEIQSAAFAAQQEQVRAELEAKAEAKSSALAKLTALGLSEEEAKALVG